MITWWKHPTDRVPSIFNGAYQTFPDGPQCYRPAMLDASLKALFQSAVCHAQSRIDWYSNNAKKKASAAKHLRRLSLILFATGTIAPISVAFFAQISEKLKFETLALLPLAEMGYILLACAGALVIFDQFFDSSGSWIRFRQSEARLQVLLAEFRFAWAGLLAQSGGAVTERNTAALTTLLRDFVTKIEILAEEETLAWAQRFSERLSSFDRNPNLKVTLSAEQPRGAGPAVVANGSSHGAGTANGSAAPPVSETARQHRAQPAPGAE